MRLVSRLMACIVDPCRSARMASALLLAIACGRLNAQAAERRGADPASAVPAEVVGFLCLDDPGAFKQNLLDSTASKMVQRSKRLSARLKTFWTMAEIALAVRTGFPLREFVDNIAEQAVLLVFDAWHEVNAGQPAYALLVDVGEHGDQVDKLLAERVVPRLRPSTSRTQPAGMNVAGCQLEVLPLPGWGPVAVGRVGRWLVAAPPQIAGQIVRTIQGKHASLADVPAYRKIRRATSQEGDGHIGFYVDAEPLRWKIERRVRTLEDVRAERVVGLDGLLAVGGTCVFREGGLATQMLCVMTSPPAGLLGMLRSAPPVDANVLRFVPEGYDAVCALNLGNGAAITRQFWQMVAPANRPLADSAVAFNGAAGQFNVNMHRDIVLRLDGDGFLALKTPRLDQLGGGSWRETLLAFDPLLGVKVRQPDKIMQAWRMLAEAGMVAAQGVKWETERVGGQTVHVFRAHGRPILGLEFSLAFVEDTALVALSFKTMAAALRAIEAGKTVASNVGFQAIRRQLPDPSSVMVLIEPARLFADLGRAMGGAIGAQSTATAATASQSISRPALPGAQGWTRRIEQRLPQWIGPLGGTDAPAREIARCLGRHPGIGLTVAPHADGLLVGSYSPFGEVALLGYAALSSHFADLRWQDTKTDTTLRRLHRTGRALDLFAAKHKELPGKLEALVPYYLDTLPGDPYARKRPLAYLRSSTADGWLLASVGPDGKADIVADGLDLAGFLKQVRSDDPADPERMKRLLYRFRPERHPDEEDPTDEGDVAVWRE